MRGKKLFSLFSHFFKYKQEQSDVNTAGNRNTCLNKTSNWPGVLHLHMVELEIIPGLSLVPRLAEPGRFALRADTLSRARLPCFFFYPHYVDCTLEEKLDTYSLIHKNILALQQLK